ncbi:hypothetical protein [Endozoicomonas lisbonensis]
MNYTELVELHRQLQKKNRYLGIQIDSNFQRIQQLHHNQSSQSSANKPFCMIIREKSNNTSPELKDLADAFSPVSSVFTSSGPVAEFFHNLRMYSGGQTDIPRLAFGQPSLDFISNGCYVVQVALDWHNGGDSMTFFRNSFPSLVVMFIETGIVLSLFFYKSRRAGRTELEAPLL